MNCFCFLKKHIQIIFSIFLNSFFDFFLNFQPFWWNYQLISKKDPCLSSRRIFSFGQANSINHQICLSQRGFCHSVKQTGSNLLLPKEDFVIWTGKSKAQSSRAESQHWRKSRGNRTCRHYIIFSMISSVCLTLCYLDLLHKSDSQIDWADHWKNNVMTTCPVSPGFPPVLWLGLAGLCNTCASNNRPSYGAVFHILTILITLS